MAEGAPKEERTEQPTSKRLSDARKKGSVPFSQEIASAITIIVLTATTVMAGPRFVRWSFSEIKEAFMLNYHDMHTPESFLLFINNKLISSFWIMTPFLAILIVSGYLTSIMISGRTYSPGALKLKFNMLNPAAGLKSLFSPQSAVKLLLSIIKVIFMGSIVYYYIKDRTIDIAVFQWADQSQILSAIGGFILGMLKKVCIGLVILGIIDLAYQKWKYISDLKMTKKEVKDEMRQKDSPPEVRQKIRQKQFEAHMQRMLQEVPKANVVLVNPTHVAVALRYDAVTMASPIVVAKGGDHLCEKIKDIARAYGVPIIRRPALARNLFSTVELNGPIPDDLYIAVAEVLALVYRLKHSIV